MNEEISPLQPEEMIAAFEVPQRLGVFVVGSGERRITFIAQQTRVLNLVQALAHTGRLREQTRVGIVGAGIAGLSAALYAAHYGARCVVLEASPDLWRLQRGCTSRWLHPYIYDWPSPGWFRPEARLPKLPWRAGNASDVTRRLEEQWMADPMRRHVELNSPITKVRLEAGDPWKLSWVGPNASSRLALPREHAVDLVFLTLGFGIEAESIYSRPYWTLDDLHQINGTVLVSGCGDGGLTDALRVCLRDFNYQELTWLASMRGLAPVCREIRRIENDRTGHPDARAITAAYKAFDLDSKTSREIKSKIRDGVRVVLNAVRPWPLDRDSSPLTRLLVAFLLKTEKVEFVSGQLRPDQVLPVTTTDGRSRFSVTISGAGAPLEVDRVVLRHGPAKPPPLQAAFPEIWELLAPRRALYKDHPEKSDETRAPLPILLEHIAPVPERRASTEPDGFPRIERGALSAELLRKLREGCRIVNVHGADSTGKSRFLYDVRLHLRNSKEFVDCLFPPDIGLEDADLYRLITERIGGGTATLRGQTLDEANKAVAAQAPRRVVFLIDDLSDSDADTTRGIPLVRRLLEFEGAAVVCSTRDPMPDLGSWAGAAGYLEVPRFTPEEAHQYLAEAAVIDAQQLAELDRRLAADETARSPARLRYLVVALSLDPTSPALAFEQAAWRHRILARNEIGGIFSKCELEPGLAPTLVAPEWLTTTIVQLLGQHALHLRIGNSTATRLLNELLDADYVRAVDGKYWATARCTEAFEAAPPEPSVYRALLGHQLRELRDAPSVRAAFAAIKYLDRSEYDPANLAIQEAEVLRVLDRALPADITLPENALLERMLKRAPEPSLKRRYARYLEERGRYGDALAAAQSAGAPWLTVGILDKQGNFDGMNDVLKRQGLSGDPGPEWPAEALLYRGRMLQATGSLRDALAAYELIEQKADAPKTCLIHGLIEAATLFVFSEQPRPALAKLRIAELHAKGNEYLRARADILRYQTRAMKLALVSGGGDPAGFANIEDVAAKTLKLAQQIQYAEGTVWGLVLHGRIAYFQRDYATAAGYFQHAGEAILANSYFSARPHLDRHWALLDAAQGEFEAAFAHLASARAQATRVGRKYLLALLSDTEAKIQVMRGDLEGARIAARAALGLYGEAALPSGGSDPVRRRLTLAEDDPSVLLTPMGAW